MSPKQTTPAADKKTKPALTEKRVRELVAVIVPIPGCCGNDADVVGLALVELVAGLTDPALGNLEAQELADLVVREVWEKSYAEFSAFLDWRKQALGGAR